jgi:hypothetical protein
MDLSHIFLAMIQRKSIKELNVRRRSRGITARTRVLANKYKKALGGVFRFYNVVKSPTKCALRGIPYSLRRKLKVKRSMKILLRHIINLEAVTEEGAAMIYHQPLPRIPRRRRTIDSFGDDEVPSYFRFQSKEQLHRLLHSFQFSGRLFRAKNGQVFDGEEVLLLGLYRMHRPTSILDGCFKAIFGFGPESVSHVFRCFLEHMLNWEYLLFDNLNFWLSKLSSCAEHIRVKLNAMGCNFPPSNTPNGFKIFGFIDNTMNATCRPGGGPQHDGTHAPRNDPQIQRAFYNGRKKLHGMKYQTISLPNGMTFHVYGPVSARQSDLFTLEHSHINQRLALLQANRPRQFAVYGDGIYVVAVDTHVKAKHHGDINDALELENECMSSCRESIEWNYGDVGKLWALVDYKKVLKMRKMPVAKMYKVAMILKDAFTCLNGSTCSEFFQMLPPTLEEWTAGGMNHHVV